MGEYKTISVPAEVKERLKEAKGDREWGDFLNDLYDEARRMRGERSFESLADELSEEELEKVAESSEEFRRRFELR
ncbi:hypothetical protein AKJ37_06765 [candidate division MSBL1 archaeon SCGC-AAA259I09]|uniref:Uncharacterized protein n=1 Tax=candidate division MSBL1 archaeon SCGC-AAA259I09 TaxID=1698267 RepID=A0A133UN78_9EURY|nr:hypothetical protein AKJ37_06765 [candidate division MSBL1 archaeon SCGC-AAA259I09]